MPLAGQRDPSPTLARMAMPMRMSVPTAPPMDGADAHAAAALSSRAEASLPWSDDSEISRR
jgi:hypothetical protein